MEKSQIGLVDCNNFFVSCERLFRPELIGKPVVVLSSNDGCVVARSQEVKDMNVPMGVPYFKIKDILKKADVTTFSSHLTLYRDISRRVFSVMQNELGEIEQYSVDEAFFKVGKDPKEVAECLKNQIEKQVGIPVSVGIAETKTQAKYANILAKKTSGIYLLGREKWSDLSPQIPLSQIWGVGGKMAMRYKQYDLNTVADIISADSERVDRLFGVAGVRLQQELMGNLVFNVDQKSAPQQSILSSRSFKKNTEDKEVLLDSVAYHLRHAVANLRSMDMHTSCLRVSIRPSRHGDFLLRGGSKDVILNAPTSDTIELLKTAKKIVDELYEPGVPYKKAGITLSRLQPSEHQQSSLFESPTSTDRAGLMKVVDDLNTAGNKELVLLGSRLHGSSWRSKSEVRSPAYTTRWSELVSVKAI